MAMKQSEDALCRLLANRVRNSVEFREWLLGWTKFHGRSVRLLDEEQKVGRPKVNSDNWWRHWWRKIPELSQERETDIFLVFEDLSDGLRFALHIENKQDAKFAPGQAEDYEPRARWMMGLPRYLNYRDFQTMLIAPASFRQMNQQKADLFHCYVSYEDIGRFIPDFLKFAEFADSQSGHSYG
jgi:hypothetical protein